MDMETSDEEEEDGQITKYEEEEERDRKLFSKAAPEEEPPITVEDLDKCRVGRNQIAKFCMAPWFAEYIKGNVPPSLNGTWVLIILIQVPGCDISSARRTSSLCTEYARLSVGHRAYPRECACLVSAVLAGHRCPRDNCQAL